MTSPADSLAVIGHDAAKKQLEAAFDSGRMHHAWLLTGNEGIGKATLAVHAAHMLLSGGANRFGRHNPGHPAARLIRAQAHPDFFVLQRPVDEKTGALRDLIPVEQARKLGPFLRLTSSQGSGRRVALIDEAHAMNRNSQNAVLKLIEEPPPGAAIFLTATTASALLPTIRSRCRVLALEPLSQTEIETILARLGVDLPGDPAEKARLVQASRGSAGLALRIMESGALPLFDEAMELLLQSPSMDVSRLHRLAEAMGKKADAETFQIVTNLLGETLRRACLSAARGGRDETGLAALLAPQGRLDRALDLWEKTERTFSMAAGANLDNKLSFIAAMLEIRRAAA